MSEERLKSIRDKAHQARGQASGFLLSGDKLGNNVHTLTTSLLDLIIELLDEIDSLKKQGHGRT